MTLRIEELDSPRNLRLLRAAFWAVAIFAGFLQTWAARFWLSPDATNYLDIASTYLRTDWKHVVNGYWSPFFSWVLALAMGIFHPVPYWESTLLHLVNFAGFLVALGCFEYFLRGLLLARRKFLGEAGEQEALPELTLWVLGYGIFLSTSLFVLNVTTTTPDVWVSVFTYIVAGLILRIRVTGGGWDLFAPLGFTLALAYLTKTFYFPISFVFLLAAWMAAGNLRRTAKQAALAAVVFFLAAGPWITALSIAKGRFTFGDTGKLNFAMMIDQIPQSHLWQGGDGAGTPKHPVRQLLSRPQLYEYAQPAGGTYPPGFDRSYWMEGMRPYFSFPGVLKVLRQSAGTFFQIWTIQLEYGVGLLTLLFLSCRKLGWIFPLRQQAYLWLPPLIACSAYAIVHVEPRLVAPFVLLLWVAAFSSVLRHAHEVPARAAFALVLAVASVTGLRVAKGIEGDMVAIFSKPRNVSWEVSQGLRVLGVRPGERVSSIGATADVYWARVAGVTIVSEVPPGEESTFWTADEGTKREVFRLFASTGAKIVVERDPPRGAEKEGWIPLGDTSFYAHPLP